MSADNPSSTCCKYQNSCWSRRHFVLAGSVGTATMLLGKVFPGRVSAEDSDREVAVTAHAPKPIAKLSELAVDQVIYFEFPKGVSNAGAMLVKLATRAGGGIGPEQDIVAFSTRCTHMGGDLFYRADHQLALCREHLTSFDLTRHGIVIAGHATESLPQIILDVQDDQIVAAGIVGLLYGHHQSPFVNKSHG